MKTVIIKSLMLIGCIGLTACGSDAVQPEQKPFRDDKIVTGPNWVQPSYVDVDGKGRILHVKDERIDLRLDLYSNSQIDTRDLVHAFGQLHKSRLSDIRGAGTVRKMERDEDKLRQDLLIRIEELESELTRAYDAGMTDGQKKARKDKTKQDIADIKNVLKRTETETTVSSSK